MRSENGSANAYGGLGIYVHIPYCLRKCRYCDFLSFPRVPEDSYF